MEVYTVLAVATALLGVILGSFLNALSFRFNTGRSIANGRSRCMSCRHELGMLDLVPVFSYLFLWGRCRYCRAHIDVQYPLVEIVGGVLSFLVFSVVSTVLAYFFWLVVWMVLLFICVYDLRHMIIPTLFSGLLALLTFFSLFLSFEPTLIFALPSWSAVLAGPLLALPLFLLSLVSGGRWMGWGDSTLELSLGWMLGIAAGLSAITYAFWSGAIIGVLLLLYARIQWRTARARFTMRSEIPFAPFLIFGAGLAFFSHVTLFETLLQTL